MRHLSGSVKRGAAGRGPGGSSTAHPQGGCPTLRAVAHLLNSVKHWIETVMPWGVPGYFTVFVLMILESACIPIPSEITMPVAGLLASEHHLGLAVAIVAGILGNLVGSLVSYAVGRSGGRALLANYGRYVLIRPHDLDRADAWFARYGQPAVFFSRILPVLRTFISLPAGVARMDLKKFTLLTFVGTLPWVIALAVAGFELGNNWDKVLNYTRPLEYLAVLLIVVLIAVAAIRRVRASRTAQT